MAGTIDGQVCMTFHKENLSVEPIECIYWENSFRLRMLKDLSHGVDGSLIASLLASAHTCRAPVVYWTSVPVMVKMALPMMRRSSSPISIGRMPGHLSRATSLQAVKACNPRINRLLTNLKGC